MTRLDTARQSPRAAATSRRGSARGVPHTHSSRSRPGKKSPRLSVSCPQGEETPRATRGQAGAETGISDTLLTHFRVTTGHTVTRWVTQNPRNLGVFAENTGLLASLTRKRSLVRSQYRPQNKTPGQSANYANTGHQQPTAKQRFDTHLTQNCVTQPDTQGHPQPHVWCGAAYMLAMSTMNGATPHPHHHYPSRDFRTTRSGRKTAAPNPPPPPSGARAPHRRRAVQTTSSSDTHSVSGARATTFGEARLLNTVEAAKLLSLSPAALRTRRSRGGGPAYIKLGSTVRYLTTDLEAWLDANRLSTPKGH